VSTVTRSLRYPLWLAFPLALAAADRDAAAQNPGASVYRSACASCHDGDGSARAPGRASLSSMTARAIFAALNEGSMREAAISLSEADRRAVAEMLSGQPLGETRLPPSASCGRSPRRRPRPSEADWTGFGGSVRGTGFRTEAQAGLKASDVARLELRWAFGFPDGTVTRSQPAVVGDRLLVAGQFGDVYSLDPATGCIQWTFAADAGVKGVIGISTPDREGRRSAVVADFRTTVYALDVETGALRWKTRVGRHPASSITGSPAVHAGRVYVPVSSMEVVSAANPIYQCCTSSGEIVALDLAAGAEVWRHRVVAEEAREVGKTDRGTPIFGPAGAPVWSSPTVDERRGILYVGTGENYTHPTTATSDAILALALESGKLVWSFQATARDAYNMACSSRAAGGNCPTPPGPDVDFGQAPLITTLPGGAEVLVVGQKLGVVYALDPDRNGAVVWSERIGRGGALGGVHWGVAAGDGLVYAPISDRVTPVDPEGTPRPGLHALALATGKPAWSQPAPPCPAARRGCFVAFSAAPAAIPGVVLTGGLDGTLRAYSSADGRVLWEFDTVREYVTVNGVRGRGGSIDGPGPTIAKGMVFVSSGYALFGQIPGNVLLAFSPRRD
jgi:polyvinyl alcohol dehydrogenase (cytochrome)